MQDSRDGQVGVRAEVEQHVAFEIEACVFRAINLDDDSPMFAGVRAVDLTY
jgi:hypothetical protein